MAPVTGGTHLVRGVLGIRLARGGAAGEVPGTDVAEVDLALGGRPASGLPADDDGAARQHLRGGRGVTGGPPAPAPLGREEQGRQEVTEPSTQAGDATWTDRLPGTDPAPGRAWKAWHRRARLLMGLAESGVAPGFPLGDAGWSQAPHPAPSHPVPSVGARHSRTQGDLSLADNTADRDFTPGADHPGHRPSCFGCRVLRARSTAPLGCPIPSHPIPGLQQPHRSLQGDPRVREGSVPAAPRGAPCGCRDGTGCRQGKAGTSAAPGKPPGPGHAEGERARGQPAQRDVQRARSTLRADAFTIREIGGSDPPGAERPQAPVPGWPHPAPVAGNLSQAATSRSQTGSLLLPPYAITAPSTLLPCQNPKVWQPPRPCARPQSHPPATASAGPAPATKPGPRPGRASAPGITLSLLELAPAARTRDRRRRRQSTGEKKNPRGWISAGGVAWLAAHPKSPWMLTAQNPKPEGLYPVTGAGPAPCQGHRLAPSLTETSPAARSPGSHHSIALAVPRRLRVLGPRQRRRC